MQKKSPWKVQIKIICLLQVLQCLDNTNEHFDIHESRDCQGVPQTQLMREPSWYIQAIEDSQQLNKHPFKKPRDTRWVIQ
jgi:hypothetical protein